MLLHEQIERAEHMLFGWGVTCESALCMNSIPVQLASSPSGKLKSWERGRAVGEGEIKRRIGWIAWKAIWNGSGGGTAAGFSYGRWKPTHIYILTQTCTLLTLFPQRDQSGHKAFCCSRSIWCPISSIPPTDVDGQIWEQSSLPSIG